VQDEVAHDNAIGSAQQGRCLAIKRVGKRPVNIREVEIHGSAKHVRLIIDTAKSDGRMSARNAGQEPPIPRTDVNHVAAKFETMRDHEVMVSLERQFDLQRELLLDFLVHSHPHGVRHEFPLIPTGASRPAKQGCCL
jgi:hypothetical protein